jgi:hypothetical protein
MIPCVFKLPELITVFKPDWQAGATDAVVEAIGRDSGWGRVRKTTGERWFWCGMAAGAWLRRLGLDPVLCRSLYHTDGARSLFTYGQEGNPCRNTRLAVDKAGGPDARPGRRYLKHGDIREAPSGSVALKYQDGQSSGTPAHVMLVLGWVGAQLVCIEGNGHGFRPSGQKAYSNVSVRTFGTGPKDDPLALIAGIGTWDPADRIGG